MEKFLDRLWKDFNYYGYRNIDAGLVVRGLAAPREREWMPAYTAYRFVFDKHLGMLTAMGPYGAVMVRVSEPWTTRLVYEPWTFHQDEDILFPRMSADEWIKNVVCSSAKDTREACRIYAAICNRMDCCKCRSYPHVETLWDRLHSCRDNDASGDGASYGRSWDRIDSDDGGIGNI